jgi:hypothetical protein
MLSPEIKMPTIYPASSVLDAAINASIAKVKRHEPGSVHAAV